MKKMYLFDMNLTAAIRVPGESPEQAKQLLLDTLQAASANFGAWPDGEPILGEVSLNEDPILADDVEPETVI